MTVYFFLFLFRIVTFSVSFPVEEAKNGNSSKALFFPFPYLTNAVVNFLTSKKFVFTNILRSIEIEVKIFLFGTREC